MRFGIPRYRLPRDVLDAEIQRILDLGVTFEPDTTVDDAPTRRCTDEGFDAAFLAVGAHIGKPRLHPGRRGGAHPRRRRRCSHDMEGAEPPQLGRRVVVYGGGNTAMDAARTAKRLGAEEAVDRLPPHARADARARLRGRRRPRRRAS